MNKQYIIANIKIPVEIKKDGTLQPELERKTIEYEICQNLPPINTENSTIIGGLIDFLKHNKIEVSQELEEKTQEQIKNDLMLFITKEELAKHASSSTSPVKKNNSQSFKRRPNNSHRFTSKKYPPIVLPKEGADPSLPQEV
jgi:hypothetical protein